MSEEPAAGRLRFAGLVAAACLLLTAPRLLLHELWRDEAWLWIVVTGSRSLADRPCWRGGLRQLGGSQPSLFEWHRDGGADPRRRVGPLPARGRLARRRDRQLGGLPSLPAAPRAPGRHSSGGTVRRGLGTLVRRARSSFRVCAAPRPGRRNDVTVEGISKASDSSASETPRRGRPPRPLRDPSGVVSTERWRQAGRTGLRARCRLDPTLRQRVIVP